MIIIHPECLQRKKFNFWQKKPPLKERGGNCYEKDRPYERPIIQMYNKFLYNFLNLILFEYKP